MQAFIILGFLAAAASAGSLGYNYAPGLSGSSYGLGNGVVSVGSGLIGSGLSGNGLVGGGLVGSGLVGSGLVGSGLVGSGLVGSGLVGSGLIGNGLIGGGSGLLGSSGYGANYQTYGSGLLNSGSSLISSGSPIVSSGGATVLSLDAVNSVPQTVELNKQFFDFSAPEEEHDPGHISRQVSNVLKKNLQVVFIKAPENNAATNAALQIAKQAIEQKTAIYVLSKENDAAQVIGTLQQIQENVPTTPEVRIIKYRTQGDLAAARNTIQSQYENIGGSSQVINGGVAPVLNYASKSVLSGNLLTSPGYVSDGSIGSSIGSIGQGVNYVSSSGALPLVGTASIGGGQYTSGVSGGNYLPASPLKK